MAARNAKSTYEAVFILSVLGCSRNIAVQHGGLCGHKSLIIINKKHFKHKKNLYFSGPLNLTTVSAHDNYNMFKIKERLELWLMFCCFDLEYKLCNAEFSII